MEANILSLLQGNIAAEQKSGESKWKHTKVKHDVTSNKKDFPLSSTKVTSK